MVLPSGQFRGHDAEIHAERLQILRETEGGSLPMSVNDKCPRESPPVSNRCLSKLLREELQRPPTLQGFPGQVWEEGEGDPSNSNEATSLMINYFSSK